MAVLQTQVYGEGGCSGQCFPGASPASLACGAAAAAHPLLPVMLSPRPWPGEVCGSGAVSLSVALFLADL